MAKGKRVLLGIYESKKRVIYDPHKKSVKGEDVYYVNILPEEVDHVVADLMKVFPKKDLRFFFGENASKKLVQSVIEQALENNFSWIGGDNTKMDTIEF